jgi:hypothetical protein
MNTRESFETSGSTTQEGSVISWNSCILQFSDVFNFKTGTFLENYDVLHFSAGYLMIAENTDRQMVTLLMNDVSERSWRNAGAVLAFDGSYE